MNNGNANYNNKTNSNRVRPVAPVPVSAATSSVVYDMPFSSIVQAWIVCEKNKRTSNSCTKFRWHAALRLYDLWREICEGRYKQWMSTVFLISYPVLREVWAAAFRDRIVHHWEDLRFRPVMEDFFIEVGDRSMNCRKGYGALRAVRTFSKMIYDYTWGYTRDDCWIVGGDFANFFMSIDKDILWESFSQIMQERYSSPDKNALLYLMASTIFHSGTQNYHRCSPASKWADLPPRKSLFHMHGLEIGNLPNQILANFQGAIFTYWAVHVKCVDGFIIFVDDFRFLVRSQEEGRRLLDEFRDWLSEQLHITLHPDKIFLQHYSKGTKLVGAVIKPPVNRTSFHSRIEQMRLWVKRGFDGKINPRKFAKFLFSDFGQSKRTTARIYISNRTRGHFITTMISFNRRAVDEKACIAMLDELRSSVNSYLGMMRHYNSYRVRSKICLKYILPVWGKYIYFDNAFTRLAIKREYDPLSTLRRRLRNHSFAARFIRQKYIPED